MSEDAALLQEALDRVGLRARAVVMPTAWDIGPVACFLFPDEPVTLIDCGVDSPEGRELLTEALGAEGLRPADVKRILVTHVHTDHFGGALWLQPLSACEVLLHPVDIAIMANFDSKEAGRELFGPLGFDDALMENFMNGDFEWRAPDFAPLNEATYETGNHRLLVEHRAGHTPGHVWITDEKTGAIFVGDYLLANHPTNAGLEIDRGQASGIAPLLQRYNAGLRELRERPAPVLLPAHGPPITDHARVIDRRLVKSDRRTRHVLDALPQDTARHSAADRQDALRRASRAELGSPGRRRGTPRPARRRGACDVADGGGWGLALRSRRPITGRFGCLKPSSSPLPARPSDGRRRDR